VGPPARVLRDPLPGIWLMGTPAGVPAAGLPPYSVEGRAISQHRLAGRGGEVWTEAESQLGRELAAIERAKGTRGQIRGSTDGSGGAIIARPESDAPTLAELGLPGRHIVITC
jgi:hypothetical protein